MKNVTALMLCCGLTACSGEEAQMQSADHVFTNGKVFTVDDDNPWAEAVAVKDDEIIFVGREADIQNYVSPTTVNHDLKGRMLLPGFIDSHAHPVLGGGYVNALSLDSFAGPEDWIKALKEYADANKELPLIFGYGFLASAYGENGPTKEMIDEIIPDRPVFIMDEGFHSGWANSLVMKQLGITRGTIDPTPGFDMYKRDQDGNPTGWFLEGTSTAAMAKLDVFSEQSVADGMVQEFDIMNAYGITAVYDAGYFEVANVALGALRRLDATDQFTVRLVGSELISSPDHIEGALDRLELSAQDRSSENYHIRVLKILNDGTVEARTAAMFEDYQNDPGNSGATVLTEQQLTDLVVDAAGRDVDVHIHALGERTIHEALNAIEVARARNEASTSRYVICHVQVILDDDIKRFAELDVIAQSTPLWANYDDEGKKFVSDDQFNRFFPFNSLKNAGVRLTFGSDYPSSGAGTLGISPIFNMEIGHTRQLVGDKNGPIQPPVTERLDVETLIRGYTYDAAYQMQMEDEIGSIEVGKKADLIILDKNPLEADPYDIHKIEVDMTMMNGQVVFQK